VRGLVFAELPGRFGKGQRLWQISRRRWPTGTFPDRDRPRDLRAMAAAYRTLGDEPRSRELLRQSGAQSLEAPSVLTDVRGPEEASASPTCAVREGEDLRPEGFDFANIAFLVNEEGVVAIDAGTTEEWRCRG